MKKFTTAEIRDLYNRFYREEISFPRMVEIMNERVDETNEPPYKDGDFVVNEQGDVLIFKEKVEDRIYDYAYLVGAITLINDTSSQILIKRLATEAEKQELLDALAKEGKRWNAEKKCVEDIPVRKFKSGDKVRIKEGISSKTYSNIGPSFVWEMDALIGEIMIVDRYTYGDSYVACEEIEYVFLAEWLEPYEGLEHGDLAIFWDSDKGSAFIGEYNCFLKDVKYPHRDNRDDVWVNAIKFESIEQYRKLLKGEI